MATPPALVLELEKTELQLEIFAQFTFSSVNFVSEVASMSGKLSSSHNNSSSTGLFLLRDLTLKRTIERSRCFLDLGKHFLSQLTLRYLQSALSNPSKLGS